MLFPIARAFLLAALFALPLPASGKPRIVSLLPSLTEDLFAIGAGPQVVGVSMFTDFPRAAVRLPMVGSSSSIDAERIVRLHPDLVVGIPAQAALVADLRRSGLRVELLRDDSFDDLFDTLRRLGKLAGHSAEAAALERRLHARTAELVRRIPAGPRPKVFIVLDTTPIFTVGDASYIADLLQLAGARNASGVRAPYARYSAEALVAKQPDALVGDRASGLAAALQREPWSALRAVRAGRVYVLADADILERPGPRYNAGLEWLIGHVHARAALAK